LSKGRENKIQKITIKKEENEAQVSNRRRARADMDLEYSQEELKYKKI
jgi:hypothetical protein